MDRELYRLVHKAKNGDQEAFAELIKRYQGPVFRHALAMVDDRMDAEDIAQEAFVKAFYALPKLENEYAFASWLTRMVSNLCYDHLKKKKKRKTVPENENLPQLRETIENVQLNLALREALQTLSPAHREALILCDIQGFSYKEIAEIMNIPLGTVKSRISTARWEMRKALLGGEKNG